MSGVERLASGYPVGACCTGVAGDMETWLLRESEKRNFARRVFENGGGGLSGEQQTIVYKRLAELLSNIWKKN